MKLIKINEEHYVIVDGTKTNVGDWITDKYKVWKWNDDCSLLGRKKITHSTQPFNFDFIEPLVLSEVKELIGEVDVEKKAREEILYNEQKREWWKQGYTQALEDNNEKKYTEEDMLRLLYWADSDARNIQGQKFDDFIQSLHPKTEWEVKFINGKLAIL